MTIELVRIGVIRTPFDAPSGMPKNPAAAEGSAGSVEVEPAYAPGLQDLAGFSHLILLFHLDRSDGYEPTFVPPGQRAPRGVFATRSPRRPNPLGMSVVRLDRVVDEVLTVRDVDMVDGTPLLDIKPYLPSIDAHGEARIGWMAADRGHGE